MHALPDPVVALHRIISPVAVDAFRDEYWERQPLASNVPARCFDDLLTIENIDGLLSSGQLQPPNVRLMRAGSPVGLPEYPFERQRTDATPTLDIRQLAAEFYDGATIIVQALHHWWHPLALFCRQLEVALNHPAQANAYLTPASAQGLPLHYDTHDVFVLQASGSKQWRVYGPAVALPLPHQIEPCCARPEEAPVLSLTLRAGDVLYLPRGWRHEATTTRDESLHLTIGVRAYTWMEALMDALLDCDNEIDLRRAVPSGGVTEANLLDLVASRFRPEDVSLRMRRRLVGTRRPVLLGQLGQLRDLAHVSTRTLLRRRRTVMADLDFVDGRPVLRFEGRELSFPQEAYEAVQACYVATTPFTPCDLGGLDDNGRMVLVRRLVREAFLELVPDDSRLWP